MGRKGKWLICALFVAWTLMIFNRSMQPAAVSDQESGALLGFLQDFLPLKLTMYQIRKAAHFAEFAVLGILAQLLFGGFCRTARGSILFAVFAGLVIALCDETIQLFVLGRTGQVKDIWLDVSGAVSGALAVAAIRWLLKKGKHT